jgi:hypothetical protein
MGRSEPQPHANRSGRPRTKDPLDAEEREAVADDREADLDAREALTVADESARDSRQERNKNIVSKAEKRDLQADARDSSAERRDQDASLAEFLNDDNYGDNLQLRRSAASDRLQSKEDRSLAASDRSALADLDPDDDSSSVE